MQHNDINDLDFFDHVAKQWHNTQQNNNNHNDVNKDILNELTIQHKLKDQLKFIKRTLKVDVNNIIRKFPIHGINPSRIQIIIRTITDKLNTLDKLEVTMQETSNKLINLLGKDIDQQEDAIFTELLSHRNNYEQQINLLFNLLNILGVRIL